MNNNSAINNIMTRKSIRKYTTEPVSPADIKIILEAAMTAPSANNKRPYHFIVIDEKKVNKEIVKLNPYAQMMKEVPVAIAICGDTQVEDKVEFIYQACATAGQNILLAAHALGLGASWVGIQKDDDSDWDKHVNQALQLPSHVIPIALIAIGHPDEDHDILDRYEEDKVHKNVW